MKKKIIHLFILYSMILISKNTICHPSPHIIVYKNVLKGGLGDRLLTYLFAKWISLKHNVPLLYKPFTSSDTLTLSLLDKPFNEEKIKHFTKIKYIKRTNYKHINLDRRPTLFISRLKPSEPKFGVPYRDVFGHLYKDTLQNPLFKKQLQIIAKPIQKIKLLELPQNIITVAIHVRKSEGNKKPHYSTQIFSDKYKNKFDQSIIDDTSYNKVSVQKLDNPNLDKKEYCDLHRPRKFPPDQFYIDQIKKISKIFHNQPLFIYIFTNSKNPKKIVSRFQKETVNPNITFSCREENNDNKANRLEDFFSMVQFDCLIRPNSSFSQVAQLLGNYKVIIYPKGGFWRKNKLIINHIGIIQNINN